MKPQAIFLDIDGTLMDFGRSVPDSAQWALHRARENGHKIFIATGRSLGDVPEEIRRLGLDGILCAEGNHIELDGNTLYHNPIPLKELSDCLDYLDDKGAYYSLQSNSGTYITARSAFRDRELRQMEDSKFQDLFQKMKFPPYHLVEDIRREDMNKIWIFDSPVPVEELKKEFGERFRIMETRISKMGRNCCEMTPRGNTKATGIQRIIDALGILREDTFAFGDDTNDLEMLAYAGHGIAMGNARDAIKEAADDVTAPVDKDGIYLAFVKYGLVE